MEDYYKIKAVLKDKKVIFARHQTLTISVGTGIASVTYKYTKPDGAFGSGVVSTTTTLDTFIKMRYDFTYTLKSGYTISKSTSSITIQGNQYVYFEGTSTSTGGGGGGCVSADSKILTSLNGDTKEARSLITGNKIVAYDKEKKSFVQTLVLKRYILTEPTNIYTLSFDDGTELSITPKHKVLTKDGFISVWDDNGQEQISIGTRLIGKDGEKTIVGVRREVTADDTTVYNYRTIMGDAFVANGVVVENESETIVGNVVNTLFNNEGGVNTASLVGGGDISKEHV